MIEKELKQFKKMNEINIIIDYYINTELNTELKQYLMNLDGILEVDIKNDKILDIYLKYDSNSITDKIIKMEIYLFLKILKIPSLIAFDKFSFKKVCEYEVVRKDLCCEVCFKNAIEYLYDIKGITKVESNFDINGYFSIDYRKCSDIIIKCQYDSEIISNDKMKQIDINLSI